MTVESENVHRLTVKGKEIVLVGTAHVSRESAELVERTIEEEGPDTVCVELCRSRYDAIRQKANWEEMDILKIIREKRTSLLLSQLIMASFQKKIAEKFGINPGEEMLRAMQKAEEKGAEVALVDRDIRTTMTRTWRTMRLSSKFRFFFEIILSLFAAEDITEEDIEELKKHDALELAMQTFGKKLPEVKTTLIDERDRFMAHEISHATGNKIVAVVGAGHAQGILQYLTDDIDIASISEVPPKGRSGRVIAWGIPAVILGIIVAGFFHSGSEASINMIKWWIIVNGVLAGLGALVVMAHPVTIISSVLAAPLTSINPTIAAGWVAGLVEASLRKPQVKDFMALKDDISTVKGFWHNKITRILLVVVFVNLGSAIGTFVAIPLMMRVL
ncbi:MAG: TraB/GumN family protein [Thermodesulfobacteriota bacterium]|nr:TraB/GumN family protein [Thermodesulfobacteriota bacterium]